MNLWILFSLINGITALSFGFFVYLKEREKILNKAFFLMSIGVAIWSFSYAKWLLVTTQESALFWSRMLNFGATFIPIFYLHWVLNLLNLDRKKRKILILGYLITFVFLLFSFTPWYIKSVKPVLFFPYWPQAGPLYLCFIILGYIGLVGYALFQLLKTRKTAQNEKRNQIDYLILGTILGFGGGATNFPLILGISLLPPIGHPLVAIYPFLWTFAILKYHLFEIRVILTELLVGVMGIVLLVLPFLMPSMELRLLTGFVLFLFVLFGYLLIKYTHSEMKRKEEAEALAAKEKVLREEFENLARQRGEMAEQFQLMAIRSEALRKTEEEFARRAEEGTKREKELREEAERLAKIKTEFLLLSTHHWRTPLSIVKGKLSDILEGEYKKLPEKIWLDLQEIYNANERAIKTANQLIYISQIELGEYSPDLKEVDLVSLIKNASIGFKMEARRRGLKFEFKEPKELPKVFVDEEQIKGVLTSLFDNAFRYTLKGKIKIEIEERENSLLTKIKDTGVGIEKEVLPLLFEGLAKGKAGYFYRMEGTGLSLYLAKKLVDLNRGKIWAESEGENKGSTFYLELPVKDNKKND